MDREDQHETLSRIEENQARIRETIEEVKRLADGSQQLLDRHRQELHAAQEPDGRLRNAAGLLLASGGKARTDRARSQSRDGFR